MASPKSTTVINIFSGTHFRLEPGRYQLTTKNNEFDNVTCTFRISGKETSTSANKPQDVVIKTLSELEVLKCTVASLPPRLNLMTIWSQPSREQQKPHTLHFDACKDRVTVAAEGSSRIHKNALFRFKNEGSPLEIRANEKEASIQTDMQENACTVTIEEMR